MLSITSTELLTADQSTSVTTCGMSPWNEGTRSSSIKLLINLRLFYQRVCEENKLLKRCSPVLTRKQSRSL